jgi:hypothetical protein
VDGKFNGKGEFTRTYNTRDGDDVEVYGGNFVDGKFMG